jgi:hypothetical protein
VDFSHGISFAQQGRNVVRWGGRPNASAIPDVCGSKAHTLEVGFGLNLNRVYGNVEASRLAEDVIAKARGQREHKELAAVYRRTGTIGLGGNRDDFRTAGRRDRNFV